MSDQPIDPGDARDEERKIAEHEPAERGPEGEAEAGMPAEGDALDDENPLTRG
jgi:hypothetical protein